MFKNGRSTTFLLKEGVKKTSNQKKNVSQSPDRVSKSVYRASIYKSKYMEKVIKPKDNTEAQFYCTLCPKRSFLLRKNAIVHVLNTATHKTSVAAGDEEEHKRLIGLILSKKEMILKKEKKTLSY